jgi:CheY-like chemotaxis protein
MPVESGFHFIQRLRALTVEEGGLTPTVAMSGGSSARETLKAGFCAHLTKPMDIRALLEVTQEFGMVRESGTRNKRGASASR